MDHKLSITETVLTDGSKTYDVWLTQADPVAGTVVLHAVDKAAAVSLAAALAAIIDEHTVDRVMEVQS